MLPVLSEKFTSVKSALLELGKLLPFRSSFIVFVLLTLFVNSFFTFITRSFLLDFLTTTFLFAAPFFVLLLLEACMLRVFGRILFPPQNYDNNKLRIFLSFFFQFAIQQQLHKGILTQTKS
jgi:hypothetical protein